MRRELQPVLALGGLIAAGLDGVERGLEPPEPLDVDPATLPADDQAAAPAAVTGRGAGRAGRDQVLTGALGPVLADSYLAVRRSEWATYSAGDDAFEQQGHFEKY